MNYWFKILSLFVFICLMGSTKVYAVDFPPDEYISHTLPVIYVNTENSAPITSEDYYLNATCYIDAMGIEGFESMGDIDNQVELQIKGRGNNSWAKPKKPYRLKFENKVSPLGMSKNRHFVLLAEWADGQGRLNWETGFFVSKLMELPWTPAHEPVELVLNGEYMGLYFLTEKIRVGAKRVNIEEQDDEETNPNKVSGGWLCEIDNYDDEPQIKFRDRITGKFVRTTIHSPEKLSDVQMSYITGFVTNTDDAIFCRDKTSEEWEKYIDIDALVRYYLVCEIVNQIECFSGSCYWWKERGDDTKINFGPVWDFDTSNAAWKTFKFCYENNEEDVIQDRNHWIAEIVKYPRFQKYVRELWNEYCDSLVSLVEPHALAFVNRVHDAAECDIRRWSSFYTDPALLNTSNRANKYIKRIKARHDWLSEQWQRPVTIIGDVNSDRQVDSVDLNIIRRYLLNISTDTLNVENANAYCDTVIDISDLVGIVRLLYKMENAGVVLPQAQSVPYGVDDKAISPKTYLTIQNLPHNNVWFPGVEYEIGICIDTDSNFSAFAADISTSDFIDITDVKVNGIDDDNYLIFTQKIDSVTTRILGYSNDLKQFEFSEPNESFLKLTLLPHNDAISEFNFLSINNLLLADNNMTPTRIMDMYIPINLHELLIGDIDGNKIIDVEDLNCLINILLKNESVGNYTFANADINRDKVIDVEDVNLLIDILLHLR